MDLDKEGAPEADPHLHVQWATDQPIPSLFRPQPLSHKQLQLLRRLTTDPNQLHQEVTQKLQRWTTRKQELQAVNSTYRTRLPQGRQSTLGKLDLFLMEEMLLEAQHTDVDYVKDLAAGFAVTGTLDPGSLGDPIPGGQRSNRRPGLGGPPDIRQLQAECLSVNQQTLERARRRLEAEVQDPSLAQEAWQKYQSDVAAGYAEPPTDLEELDLSTILLVDSFPIREQHAGSLPKVRVINNFKSNRVNDYAWTPNRLHYNNFNELQQAAMVLQGNWVGELVMAKADFK